MFLIKITSFSLVLARACHVVYHDQSSTDTVPRVTPTPISVLGTLTLYFTDATLSSGTLSATIRDHDQESGHLPQGHVRAILPMHATKSCFQWKPISIHVLHTQACMVKTFQNLYAL